MAEGWSYPATPQMNPGAPPAAAPASPAAPTSSAYPATPQMNPPLAAEPLAAPAETNPVAVTYDFDLPEGFEPAAEQLGAFKALAAQHGLAPEAATQLIALHAEAMRAEEAAVGQEVAGWRAATERLPEMQGDGRQAVARATALADPQTKAWLDASGLGNHPEFVRWAARVGRELGRLSGVKPGSLSARLYPNSPFMRD